MKTIFLSIILVNSITSFAHNKNMEHSMEKASLKTDLYFCFKAALGSKLTNDQLIDSIILKNCKTQLSEAERLDITEVEIREIAHEAIEDNKKTDLEKSFEEFSRKNYNL